MARARKRPEASPAELSMTPMIDVVFQLLIYFVVTIKPMDVITNLDVFRPAPSQKTESTETPNLFRVGVHPDGRYSLNGSQVSLERLDNYLASLAANNASQTVMIIVSYQSDHGDLIAVLDRCAKNGLKNLSVTSSPN